MTIQSVQRRIARAFALCGLALLAGSCDSLPNAFEPEGPPRTATLRIVLNCSCVMELVRATPTDPSLPTRESKTQVGSGKVWTNTYAPGEYSIYMQFWDGDNVTVSRTLVEGATASVTIID